MTTDEIQALEKEAAENNGLCPTCTHPVKIYRYTINQAVATFLRAMGDEVRNTGINNVDVSTIGIAYSVRTQVSKIRQHGLIARVKDDKGAQIPSHWLITRRGFDFLNGKNVPKKTVVFRNQVIGHEGGDTTIHAILGEKFDPNAPLYTETPVSPTEARTYNDVRTPRRDVAYQAEWKGNRYSNVFKVGEVYDIVLERLVVGRPVVLHYRSDKADDLTLEYKDIAAFQKEWKIVS